MNEPYEFYEAGADYVRTRMPFAPQIAVILGSSLGPFAERLQNTVEIDYHEVPNFPVSTAPGHAGKLMFGELAGQLAINPNTIQRAYRELESEGYILSVAGKGSFVAQVDRLAEQQKKEALNAFRAAAQRLRALGLSAEALASLLTQEEPTDD